MPLAISQRVFGTATRSSPFWIPHTNDSPPDGVHGAGGGVCAAHRRTALPARTRSPRPGCPASSNASLCCARIVPRTPSGAATQPSRGRQIARMPVLASLRPGPRVAMLARRVRHRLRSDPRPPVVALTASLRHVGGQGDRAGQRHADRRHRGGLALPPQRPAPLFLAAVALSVAGGAIMAVAKGAGVTGPNPLLGDTLSLLTSVGTRSISWR